MAIVDKTEGTTWKMSRRTELSTSGTFAQSEIQRMANGAGNDMIRERIEKMMRDMTVVRDGKNTNEHTKQI